MEGDVSTENALGKKIEGKILALNTERVEKCAVAYSGGLDSTLGVELLKRVYRAKEIVPITVDVGQGKEEVELAISRAKVLGIEPIVIDKREEFASDWLTKAIKANSDYFGYPVSTSMTRQLIAKVVAEEAEKLGCDSILEGSTGRGNDQYRMHNVFKIFAPKLKVLVPVRDFDLTRSEELELCKYWKVPVEEVISGGDDKTMWCRSIASGAIGLNQKLPDDIWMWLVPPYLAPDNGEEVELTFKEGIPVEIDGTPMELSELVAHLNTIAGRNGIGKIDMFEDGIMDMKSREIYEAPAARVILTLKRDLEGQCLTKAEREFKSMVDAKWAYMVYHGEWFHPLKAELDAFIEESQRYVNGKIKVWLYRGNIDIIERERSRSSLFFPEIRSIHSKSFNQIWAADAAKIRGLPFEILAEREKKMYG